MIEELEIICMHIRHELVITIPHYDSAYATDVVDRAIKSQSDIKDAIRSMVIDYPNLIEYTIAIVKTNYPEHVDYLNKLLVLL